VAKFPQKTILEWEKHDKAEMEKKKDIEEPLAPEKKKEVAPSESGTGNNIPSADLQSSATILQQLPPALNNLTPATPPQKPSAELKSSSSDEPSEQIVTFMTSPKSTGTQNSQSTERTVTEPLTTNPLPENEAEEIFGADDLVNVDDSKGTSNEKQNSEAEVELVKLFLTEYKKKNAGRHWINSNSDNTSLLNIIEYGKNGKAGIFYSSGDGTKTIFNSVFGINLSTDARNPEQIRASIIDAHIAAKTAADLAQKLPAQPS
jgi:hypothetical protein